MRSSVTLTFALVALFSFATSAPLAAVAGQSPTLSAPLMEAAQADY